MDEKSTEILHVTDKISSSIQTTNDFFVGSQGGKTVVVLGPHTSFPMDSAKAYRFAAWLVCIADVNRRDDEPTFKQTLKAIRRT
jgi:hypothetical protein